jgi:hypothetical protein
MGRWFLIVDLFSMNCFASRDDRGDPGAGQAEDLGEGPLADPAAVCDVDHQVAPEFPPPNGVRVWVKWGRLSESLRCLNAGTSV